MTARLHLGCMGWQEKDWRGPFYPQAVKPPEMLAVYAQALSTVEVDSTFYGRPRESTVQTWRESVGDDFRFALKVPREVTHRRRFREAEQVFSFFIERARTLGPKLGAILIQCGRDFGPTPANRKHLFSFLDAELPSDINVALELRHEGWFEESLFAMARSQRFALAAVEGEHASLELAERILTEQSDALDFAYLRLMGTAAFEHYDRVQVDRSESLGTWARLIKDVRGRVGDVFGYVSDDYSGHSPATVADLLGRLGEEPPPNLVSPLFGQSTA
jgi:uncharacterized protein YecE (DUF72 family)